jgi:hypothetical protein
MTRITRTLTAAGLALSIAIGAVGASATPGPRQQRRRRRDHRRPHRALCHRAGIQNDNRNVTVTRNYGHRPSGGRAHVPHRPQPLVAPARCFIEGERQRNGSSAAMSGAACRTTSRRADLLPQTLPAPRRDPAWAPDDLWRPLPGAERLGPRGRFPALRGHPQPTKTPPETGRAAVTPTAALSLCPGPRHGMTGHAPTQDDAGFPFRDRPDGGGRARWSPVWMRSGAGRWPGR